MKRLPPGIREVVCDHLPIPFTGGDGRLDQVRVHEVHLRPVPGGGGCGSRGEPARLQPDPLLHVLAATIGGRPPYVQVLCVL